MEKNAEPTAKDAAKNIRDAAQKVRHFQGSASNVTLPSLCRGLVLECALAFHRCKCPLITRWLKGEHQQHALTV